MFWNGLEHKGQATKLESMQCFEHSKKPRFNLASSVFALRSKQRSNNLLHGTLRAHEQERWASGEASRGR